MEEITAPEGWPEGLAQREDRNIARQTPRAALLENPVQPLEAHGSEPTTTIVPRALVISFTWKMKVPGFAKT